VIELIIDAVHRAIGTEVQLFTDCAGLIAVFAQILICKKSLRAFDKASAIYLCWGETLVAKLI
jgi:hypothetical protein